MKSSLAPADPASRWTSAHRGPAFHAYSTNYLIDLDHAVIMDVEASTAVRQAELTACKRMISRVQDRFGVRPERLAADTAYGSAEMLAWRVHERGIHPHLPVFDKSARRDGTFERDAFTYDHEDDSYVCPGGKRLRPRNRHFATARGDVGQDGFIRYRAQQQDCGGCGLRQRCTPNMPARKVTRSIHEGARDLARDIATTDAYVTSRRQRKKVEMLFAHLKRILKLDRLRLRGPNGAKDEFLLAATAQNLRKLAKLIPMPAQPLPALAGSAPLGRLRTTSRHRPTPTSSTQSSRSGHAIAATSSQVVAGHGRSYVEVPVADRDARRAGPTHLWTRYCCTLALACVGEGLAGQNRSQTIHQQIWPGSSLTRGTSFRV